MLNSTKCECLGHHLVTATHSALGYARTENYATVNKLGSHTLNSRASYTHLRNTMLGGCAYITVVLATLDYSCGIISQASHLFSMHS